MSIRKQPSSTRWPNGHTVKDQHLTSAFLLQPRRLSRDEEGRRRQDHHIGSMMSISGAPFATAYAASKGASPV